MSLEGVSGLLRVFMFFLAEPFEQLRLLTFTFKSCLANPKVNASPFFAGCVGCKLRLFPRLRNAAARMAAATLGAYKKSDAPIAPEGTFLPLVRLPPAIYKQSTDLL